MKSGFSAGWRWRIGIACTVAAAGCNAILGNNSSTTDDHLFDDAGAGTDSSALDGNALADTSPAEDACPMGQAACPSGCTNVMIDPANCGQCGSVCGGSCVASECQPIVLAAGLNVPESIGVDSTHVFWTDRGTTTGMAANGNVSKVLLGGGAVETVVSPTDQPYGLAVDATGSTQLFFSSIANPHAIFGVNGDGGALNTFNNSSISETRTLAFNATTLFGADQAGKIWAEARIGNPMPTTDTSTAAPVQIVVDGADLFVTEKTGCAIGTMSGVIEKGSVSNIAGIQNWLTGLKCPWGIATTSLYVYYTDHGTTGGDGAIMKALRAGNTSAPIVSNVSFPTAIAVDGTSVYWIEQGAFGTIAAANQDGSNKRVLATKQANPVAIAVDATSVYWLTQGTSAGNGALNRLAK